MTFSIASRENYGKTAGMIFRSLTIIVLVLSIAACVSQSRRMAASDAAYQDVYVPSGTSVPALSIGFEVAYDPQTDNIVPGYKIITVAITNSSLEYLQTDEMVDQWWVVDRGKNRHKAVLNLREKNPDAWAKLPPRLRKFVQYPLMVRIGDSTTIDLLFPNTINLNEYREVVFKSSARQKIIHIVPRE